MFLAATNDTNFDMNPANDRWVSSRAIFEEKIDEETTSSQYTVWQYLEVTTKYQYRYVTLSG